MQHISTIDQLIDFLGGNVAVAERLGLDPTAVIHWKSRKQIAAGWHLRLLAEVRRRGATIDPEVFGLSEEEALGLFDPPKHRAFPPPAYA